MHRCQLLRVLFRACSKEKVPFDIKNTRRLSFNIARNEERARRVAIFSIVAKVVLKAHASQISEDGSPSCNDDRIDLHSWNFCGSRLGIFKLQSIYPVFISYAIAEWLKILL